MNEDDIRALLHDAADGISDPPDLATRAVRRYRTRRARRYAVVAGATLVVIAGAVTAVATTRNDSAEVVVAPTSTTVPSARHGVSARIELPSDTIVSGSKVEGTIVVENDTGKRIPEAGPPIRQAGRFGCGQQWTVALGNDHVHPAIGFPSVGCPRPSTETLPVGTSRWPFELRAVDWSPCSLPGEPSKPPTRTCPSTGESPLPAGDSRTEFFADSLKALDPSLLTVHVVAATASYHVELRSDTMVSGSSQQGTLVVDNDTGASVPALPCGWQMFSRTASRHRKCTARRIASCSLIPSSRSARPAIPSPSMRGTGAACRRCPVPYCRVRFSRRASRRSRPATIG